MEHVEDARARFRRLVRREAAGVSKNWSTTNGSRGCTRKAALYRPRFSPVGGGGACVTAVRYEADPRFGRWHGDLRSGVVRLDTGRGRGGGAVGRHGSSWHPG